MTTDQAKPRLRLITTTVTTAFLTIIFLGGARVDTPASASPPTTAAPLNALRIEHRSAALPISAPSATSRTAQRQVLPPPFPAQHSRPHQARAATRLPFSKPSFTAYRQPSPHVFSSPAPQDEPGRFRWPLEPAPVVVRPFHPPPGPYAAGHRGVDLAAVPGAPVLASADGVVVFVGRVVDRSVVSISHDGGCGPPMSPWSRRSVPGTGCGRVSGSGCSSPGTGGVRGPLACTGGCGGRVYLDPLQALVALRVRLLPL
ncbi:peptidoglycan DD-metalloendopeptidase family protein [Actinokineospora soli]|uniref:Peptidoglycan DD-metalloendopeptidase family protein n=1 Tax=Actinokineospora soli TaxID=1048753 RepID=A0ABW2TWS9_9PSEU